MKKANVHYLAKLALLCALLVAMDLTGLAMIPLPGQYLSLMTVPVAIGAMMLGPLAGAVLGATMGCISFFTAMKRGFDTLFLIGYDGWVVIALSLLNTLVPRILMGACTGWIFKLVHRLDKTGTLSYYIGGIAAPLLNTLLYMFVLIVIFGNAPMLEAVLTEELLELFRRNILLFLSAYVGVQALIEAAVGCIVSGTVGKTLSVVFQK